MRLSKLFVTPNVILRVRTPDRVTEVRVEGFLCERLCVLRVQGALAKLPGVERVTSYPRSGTFVVQHRGTLEPEAVRAAVLGKVVLLWARRLLVRLGYILPLPYPV